MLPFLPKPLKYKYKFTQYNWEVSHNVCMLHIWNVSKECIIVEVYRKRFHSQWIDITIVFRYIYRALSHYRRWIIWHLLCSYIMSHWDASVNGTLLHRTQDVCCNISLVNFTGGFLRLDFHAKWTRRLHDHRALLASGIFPRGLVGQVLHQFHSSGR